MSEPYHWYTDKAFLGGCVVVAMMAITSLIMLQIAYKTPSYWNEAPCSFPENVDSKICHDMGYVNGTKLNNCVQLGRCDID